MSVVSKRAIRISGLLLASAALVLSSQTAAGANDRQGTAGHQGSDDGPAVISIDVAADGSFSMPDSVHAGFVTFRVSSADAGFHGLQGFSLNRGVTIDQAMSDISLAVSGDIATMAQGMQALNRDIVEIGGAVTNPFGAQEVTVALTRGTYYFLDLSTVGSPITPTIRTLHVRGDFERSRLPRFSAVIQATMVNGQPTFHAPSSLPHNGTFLARVSADELHEVVFRPTRPGVTNQYISDFYGAIVNGGTPGPSPWTGIQAGMQSISPGRWAIVHINLPPGPYALVCYVPSDESGWPHAYIGMHQLMTLT